MKRVIQTLVLSMTLFFGHVVMAEPTVQEIYKTSQTNKEQALSMINQVIEKHPNSSKAYFVKTEILLAMGKTWLAKETFLKAESLDPTFSYAKPESVTRVRNVLGIKPKSTSSIGNENMIIVGGIILAGILIIWLIVRKRQSESSPGYMPTNYMNRPITPFHPAPGNTTTQPQPTGGSGGSNIMSSLATGAAVGAGAVAGAALANHLINGNNSGHRGESTRTVDQEYTPSSDFGVSDSGSWDSGSDSGSSSDSSGSDW